MSLQDKCFSGECYTDILSVLNESCTRIVYNLSVVYNELSAIGYNFCKETKYNWQRPLLKPLPDTDKLLVNLDKLVKPYYVPESLKIFYKVVGGCNFAWDYETGPEIPGKELIQFKLFH